MNLKGTLPMLILRSLEDGPLHGYRIATLIKARSKGVLDFREGTLYPALHDLENKGSIESFEATESNRVRIYYRLTDRGRKSLDDERAAWAQLSQAITLALEGR